MNSLYVGTVVPQYGLCQECGSWTDDWVFRSMCSDCAQVSWTEGALRYDEVMQSTFLFVDGKWMVLC